jgi:hypothetical protein
MGGSIPVSPPGPRPQSNPVLNQLTAQIALSVLEPIFKAQFKTLALHGRSLLYEHDPAWHERVNPDRLDLRRFQYDVVGQWGGMAVGPDTELPFPQWCGILSRLGLNWYLHDLRQYGFMLPVLADEKQRAIVYPWATQVWADIVRAERRGELPPPQTLPDPPLWTDSDRPWPTFGPLD